VNPDPFIGRRLFVDGIVRPVFLDDADGQSGRAYALLWDVVAR